MIEHPLMNSPMTTANCPDFSQWQRPEWFNPLVDFWRSAGLSWHFTTSLYLSERLLSSFLGLARNSKHMTQSFIINTRWGPPPTTGRRWNRGAERHSAAVPYARQDNARLRYIYRWPGDCARCPQSVDSDFTNSRCIRRLVA